MILSQRKAYTSSPFLPVAEGAALHRAETDGGTGF
jgi:hypothetical protein